MDRRDFLKRCAAVSAGGYLLSNKGVDVNVKHKRPPNIVFLMIDDMGQRDVGFMGSDYYETPMIDKLAGQGMVFTDAYANAANCAPTRACFLTGQYSPRHGVFTVGDPARGSSSDHRVIPIANDTTLDSHHVTMAELLGPAGYVSINIGKWHMGN
ncbi:MAG: sulfatase-like hydrolase/transferase, partial [Planctomycetes bacterium]|nr:sulfatase-like hydrolase/transferase [Planctomycetota bacterium]